MTLGGTEEIVGAVVGVAMRDRYLDALAEVDRVLDVVLFLQAHVSIELCLETNP
jgi:hypothetical protein